MAKLTSLCVYCGSHEGLNGAFREAATELGGLLAARGVRLVFGGVEGHRSDARRQHHPHHRSARPLPAVRPASGRRLDLAVRLQAQAKPVVAQPEAMLADQLLVEVLGREVRVARLEQLQHPHHLVHRRAARRDPPMPSMAKLTSLCVYCGSHEGLNGALDDAVLDNGGEVIGVVPAHLRHVELGHPDLKELHVVDSMHERKQLMFELADAFAILPGGLGTLDEAIEMVTWKQLRLHDKPIVLVDHEGYWAPLRELIRHVIENGFAAREAADLLTVVPDVAAIFPAIEAAPETRLKIPRSKL